MLFGHHLALAGRLVNGHAGTRVAIFARPYGRSTLVHVATVTTRAGGRYHVLTHPAIQTTYLARIGNVTPSKAVVVGVRPAMSVKELANGALRAHVSAGSSLRGRMVELQRLAGGRWQTIVKLPLRRNSTATFSPTLARGTVRVAMSVNQAGAGYLGNLQSPAPVPRGLTALPGGPGGASRLPGPPPRRLLAAVTDFRARRRVSS